MLSTLGHGRGRESAKAQVRLRGILASYLGISRSTVGFGACSLDSFSHWIVAGAGSEVELSHLLTARGGLIGRDSGVVNSEDWSVSYPVFEAVVPRPGPDFRLITVGDHGHTGQIYEVVQSELGPFVGLEITCQ